jgi:hypothetical protein
MKRVEERRATWLYVLVPALALERAALLSCTVKAGRAKARSGLWFPKLDGRLLPRLSFHRDGVIIAQPVDQRYAAGIGPDPALWWDESHPQALV